MPVAKETHDEGEHYIIRTPSAEFEPQYRYNGRVMDIRFRDGIARTRSRQKAQIFDEQFGYEVIGWEGAPTWENAPDPSLPQGQDSDWGEDDDFVLVDDDEEDEGTGWGVTGQFEKPVAAAKGAKMGLQEAAAGDRDSEE